MLTLVLLLGDRNYFIPRKRPSFRCLPDRVRGIPSFLDIRRFTRSIPRALLHEKVNPRKILMQENVVDLGVGVAWRGFLGCIRNDLRNRGARVGRTILGDSNNPITFEQGELIAVTSLSLFWAVPNSADYPADVNSVPHEPVPDLSEAILPLLVAQS